MPSKGLTLRRITVDIHLTPRLPGVAEVVTGSLVLATLLNATGPQYANLQLLTPDLPDTAELHFRAHIHKGQAVSKITGDHVIKILTAKYKPHLRSVQARRWSKHDKVPLKPPCTAHSRETEWVHGKCPVRKRSAAQLEHDDNESEVQQQQQQRQLPLEQKPVDAMSEDEVRAALAAARTTLAAQGESLQTHTRELQHIKQQVHHLQQLKACTRALALQLQLDDQQRTLVRAAVAEVNGRLNMNYIEPFPHSPEAASEAVQHSMYLLCLRNKPEPEDDTEQ